MVKLSPEEFIKRFCVDFPPLNHHFTGPPQNHQAQGHGSVFAIEGKILAGLAARVGGPVLEIGADQGISTRYLHEGLARYAQSGKSTFVYSVDNNHKWAEDRAWPLRVRVVADSGTYTPPTPCRLAFIDGDHRYAGVVRDITQAVKAGITRLLFHDTSPSFDGKTPTNTSDGSEARRAVLEAFGNTADWEVYDITTPCGMIYVVKKEYFCPPPGPFCDPAAGSGGCCDGAPV